MLRFSLPISTRLLVTLSARTSLVHGDFRMQAVVHLHCTFDRYGYDALLLYGSHCTQAIPLQPITERDCGIFRSGHRDPDCRLHPFPGCYRSNAEVRLLSKLYRSRDVR